MTTLTHNQLKRLRWLVDQGGSVKEHRMGRGHLIWKSLAKRGFVDIMAKSGYMDLSGKMTWTSYDITITDAGRQARSEADGE